MRHPFQAPTNLALTLLLSASCTHRIVRIHEVPSPQRVANDPALRGEGMPLLNGAPPPAQFEEKDAVFQKIQWLPTASFDLKPGETRVLTVAVTKGATLLARAAWSGGAGPLTVSVMKDGLVLASGISHLQTTGRGIALARGDSTTSGSATASILNTGSAVVKVTADVGTLAGGQ